MALPKIKMPKGTVDVDGNKVEVHGLTRGEAAKLQALVAADAEPTELEIVMLSLGTDTTEEEARAWYNEAPAGVVSPILEEIQRLSGMGAAQFPDGKSDSAGGS